ncbi:hypothetical protein M9487_002010 [Salmonella enterica]|nr:hypothetical protein [Salmonella enterica]
MPKNSVFICGAVLMALSTGAFAQPTPAITPSAEVASAASGREPAAAAVPSTSTTDTSDIVPINPGDGLTGGQLEVLQGKTLLLQRLAVNLRQLPCRRRRPQTPQILSRLTPVMV